MRGKESCRWTPAGLLSTVRLATVALATVFLATWLRAGVAAAEQLPANFAVVLLPDTQNYSEQFPETYVAQTCWIAQHAAAENIRFVIHLGDIVQVAGERPQWENANRAQSILDGLVPYSMLPGNHDGSPGDTKLYNEYFPPQRFACRPWYGGHLGKTNDANYCYFHAGGMALMVISLGNDPGDETLAWAGAIADLHPDHRVIVATHMYMEAEQRNDVGQRIWQQLVRRHANIFMVVCGHVGAAAYQTSVNDAGSTVHEILCDYQNKPNGGNGWLEVLRFAPGENKIRLDAYSPLLDRHDPRLASVDEIDYDMSPRDVEGLCCPAALGASHCQTVGIGHSHRRQPAGKPVRRLLRLLRVGR